MQASASRIKEVCDRYTEKDWHDLCKRLTYFTHRRYPWTRYASMGDVGADDLIQQALTDMFTGVRQWPEELALFTFLCGVISSKAGHLLDSRRRLVHMDDKGWRPEPGREEARGEDDYRQMCQEIREKVYGDDVLERMVEVWFVEPDLKPCELAGRLGLPIEEVRNAQKRLRRKLRDLREKGTMKDDE